MATWEEVSLIIRGRDSLMLEEWSSSLSPPPPHPGLEWRREGQRREGKISVQINKAAIWLSIM